jgi:hypothetical protein
MKITTKKIIRELKKRGYNETYLIKSVDEHLIRDIRDIIDEILKQHKNISINGKS